MKNSIPTPNFDEIHPLTCINGKLRKLHKLINTAYKNAYKPFDLRGSMVSILFVIGKRRGISQKEIATTLLLDESTMSRDLQKLVKRGLVQINKNTGTAKSAAELTKEGCLLLEEIAPIWHQLHQKVATILGAFNIQQIDAITAAIRINIDDLLE